MAASLAGSGPLRCEGTEPPGRAVRIAPAFSGRSHDDDAAVTCAVRRRRRATGHRLRTSTDHAERTGGRTRARALLDDGSRPRADRSALARARRSVWRGPAPAHLPVAARARWPPRLRCARRVPRHGRVAGGADAAVRARGHQHPTHRPAAWREAVHRRADLAGGEAYVDRAGRGVRRVRHACRRQHAAGVVPLLPGAEGAETDEATSGQRRCDGASVLRSTGSASSTVGSTTSSG